MTWLVAALRWLLGNEMPFWLINYHQHVYLGVFPTEVAAYTYFYDIYVKPYISAHPRHWALYRWMSQEEMLRHQGFVISQREVGEVVANACQSVITVS